MKTITNKTVLKQGDKTYQPIEVDSVIYWVDENFVSYSPYYLITSRNIIAKYTIERPILLKDNRGKIVAQSQSKLEGVPVISLWETCWNKNANQYTQKDIEKAIELATKSNFDARLRYDDLKNQVIDQINSISVIEVDEQFNIISYE